MVMPGRKWNPDAYRYGFGGHEMSNEIKGIGNSYTAEFWEYDPRLARRWNIDPVFKEYESPYAAFANNPVWNIDKDGSDTSKYLSSKQTVDAIKIAFAVLKDRLDTKTYNKSGDYSKEIEQAITDYWKKNQGCFSFGAAEEFRQQTYEYVKGLKEVASSVDGANIFNDYGKRILYDKRVSNEITVQETQKLINSKNGELAKVMGAGLEALGISLGAVDPVPIGNAGPRAPFISGTQRAIVDSKAGFNFTSTTIKRFTDPARAVSAADLRRAVGSTPYVDPQDAAGANAYYTTILKNGKSYNLKVVYHAESNTIFHFHYSRQAMGPLSKIKK